MTFLRGSTLRLIIALAAAAGLAAACPAEDGEDDDAADTGADDGDDDDDDDDGADATAAGDDSAVLGCAAGAVGETTGGQTEPLMDTWGAACSTDADCVALLGDGAICETQAVVYELPGGYCTKPCALPDADTRVVPDHPDCDGVACIGQMGFFERCAPICEDDMQCNRDGYVCRTLPMIGSETDPRQCLMPDCCLDTCEE